MLTINRQGLDCRYKFGIEASLSTDGTTWAVSGVPGIRLFGYEEENQIWIPRRQNLFSQMNDSPPSTMALDSSAQNDCCVKRR